MKRTRFSWSAFILVAVSALVFLPLPSSVSAQLKGSAASMKKPLPDISAGPTKRCEAKNHLPDPDCTPGVTNPNITQANIGLNICKRAWTGKSWTGKNPYTGKPATGTSILRPSTSYTSKLRNLQMVEYGIGDKKPGDYEEDHLISLQLGGNPVDPRNLWPEFGASPNTKDGFENYLNAMICQRKMTLKEAQRQIATDWFKYWTEAGKPKGAAAANTAQKVP
jgi:hypothetical protein